MANTIFWFRRDLRVEDNAGLYRALRQHGDVLPIFIFDTIILDQLSSTKDARVHFIYEQIKELKEKLIALGSDLEVYHGRPIEVWESILSTHQPKEVVANHDYETYATERDAAIQTMCDNMGARFTTYKDHVIFEKDEILKSDGKPYTVFTPYKNRWLEKLMSTKGIHSDHFYTESYPTEKYFQFLHKVKNPSELMPIEALGFKASDITFPSKVVSSTIITNYEKNRNFPGIEGTSKLGVHYRFGTISIREKARRAQQLNQTYLSELIWRDFYAMILYHFPYVEHQSFRKEYDLIEWINDEEQFAAWKAGKTGYPLVDAGMRELIATGYMHNRVRMVVASFLTKHLLIDWRWGEAWFASQLLDYDLASNNGGWQWAAGCGTDAAPYFRIFNPQAQAEKFDSEHVYIKKWVPEWGTSAYCKPIVDHAFARNRCLEVYKKALADK